MPTSPASLLREAGLRVTGPRLAVLDALQTLPHADAATVLSATREREAGVSVQGVYDVLDALHQAGVLRRIQPARSVARFEVDGGDNHHHVVCRGCDALVDVPCTSGRPPCLDAGAAESVGFAVDEAEVLFWGLCPSCRQASGPVPGPADPTLRTTSGHDPPHDLRHDPRQEGADMTETHPGFVNAEHTGAGAVPTGSTTSNGAPNDSDRNSLSVGPNGPLLLHDVALIENLAHFDREKVPERLPHAKGSGAFGVFEVTEDVSAWTKAAVFQQGASTEVLLRFSTVAGEQGSPDTWRDVRGFAVRLYTDEGNLDIVGNNTPIFFVRDPMKFPNFIRSQRRTPDSGLRSANMQWDFWTANPETSHQVSYVMGDRGLPKTWRHMNGYSSHTYMWVNEAGERFFVKYHWHSNQGVENMTNEQAGELAGSDADFHRRDLFEAIEGGDHPSWTLSMQIMPYEEAKTYRFNPFDLTKVWPHADYPLHKVGTLTLNRNPQNWFAQIEQAAFSPSNQVRGTGVSPDKMLLARVFSYPDAQRHRIGANFTHLPVNQPKVQVNAYQFDGPMAYLHSGSQPTYVTNAYGRPWSDQTGPVENGWEADGELVRQAYDLRPDDSDFGQAHALVREVYSEEARERLVQTIAGMMGEVDPQVRERVYEYWRNIDQEVGERIEAAAQAQIDEDVPGLTHEDTESATSLREPDSDLVAGHR